jgi:molybdate transport system regulatory protein
MTLRVRSKIWIENEEGELIIGTGRLRILEAIIEVGSMNKAATKLKQPFRAVWGKIRATENRCGFKIVQRTGDGSKLTPEGLQLFSSYMRLRNRCKKFTDEQFQDLFGDLDDRKPDSDSE